MPRYEALPVDNNFDLGDASDSDTEGDNTPRRPARSTQNLNRPSSPVHHPLLPSEQDDSPPPSPSTSRRPEASAQPLSITTNNEVIFSAPPEGDEEAADDSYMQPPPTPPGGFHYPPPPGNPPPVVGNSNGVPIPANYHAPSPPASSVLRRALGAILPVAYQPRSMRIVHPQGGGMRNDGVFANMSAKPDGRQSMRRGLNEESDNPDWVPEVASTQAPPSYLSAQADAVPPYYEASLGGSTTFSGPISPNASLLIDNLPPGSLFSFLWNLLVSLSFQFVGFLLTYLLHTSHAAKQGSRAGLGITLIQYGFYLRQRADTLAQGTMDSNGIWHFPGDDPAPSSDPTFATGKEADAYHKLHNDTLPLPTQPASSLPYADGSMPAGANPMFPHELSVANEWLSFFLMTIGWFVLLTSILSYWRVKRWERNVRRQAEERAREEAAQLETVEGGGSAAAGSSSAAASSAEGEGEQQPRYAVARLLARIGRVGRVGRARVPFMAGGGLGRAWGRPPGQAARAAREGEGGEESHRLEAVD